MKYVGAKYKIGHDISEIINSIVDPKCVDGYFEPFCGSLGMFTHMIKYSYKKYIASDRHSDLIKMWKDLQTNKLILPKKFDEDDYNELKNLKSPNAMKAVGGFGMSFGGKYFGGFIQKYSGDSGRNFYEELNNSLNKTKTKIQKSNIKFYNKSYSEWNPKNMLIYCDPPYAKTTGYSTGGFNNKDFWNLMKIWSKTNYVFISEESAPSGFVSIWSKVKKRTLDKKDRKFSTEKLFVYKYGMLYRLCSSTKKTKCRKKTNRINKITCKKIK
tara:strand:+ start:1182 stop:1991 length:810 start_codon:yes stop_codon:yes gene_type:complete